MPQLAEPAETDTSQWIHAVFDWVDYRGERQEVLSALSRYHNWLTTEAIPAGGIGPGERGRLWRRHLADSLTFLAGLDGAEASDHEIVDVGSGVGLPGIPLAIALPSVSFTLLERSGRRCELADRALRILGLENVDVLQGDATRMTLPHRMAVSRAVIAPDRFRSILQRLLPEGITAVIAGSHGEAGSRVEAGPDFEIIRVPENVLGSSAEAGTPWLAKLSLSG